MDRRVHVLLKNVFVRGSLWLTVSSFCIGLLNYGFNVLSSRVLGPERFGELTSLFAYLGVLGVPYAVINLVILKKIGGSHGDKKNSAHMWERMMIEFLKSKYIVLIGALCIIPLLPGLLHVRWYTASALVILLVVSLYSVIYDSLLMSLHIFFIPSVLSIVSVLVKLAGPLTAYVSPDPLLAIISCVVISISGKTWYQYLLFRQTVEAPITRVATLSFKHVLEVCKNQQFLIVLASVVTMTLFGTVDMVIVQLRFSPHDTGLYAAWNLLSRIVVYIFGPVLTISYTFFTHRESSFWHRRVLALSLALFLIASFIILRVYTLLSRELILMMFGSAYLPLKPYVDWAALYGCCVVALTLLNNYFVAQNYRVVLLQPVILLCYIVGLVYFCPSLDATLYFNLIFTAGFLTVYLVWFAFSSINTLQSS